MSRILRMDNLACATVVLLPLRKSTDGSRLSRSRYPISQSTRRVARHGVKCWPDMP